MLLSLIFILAGFGKLTAIASTAAWFGSLGLPFPTVVTVLVGLLELVAGLAMLIGFQTRVAAIALAVFTLAPPLIAHPTSRPAQVLLLEKNLAIIGGLLLLAAFGAGALSLDARRG